MLHLPNHRNVTAALPGFITISFLKSCHIFLSVYTDLQECHLNVVSSSKAAAFLKQLSLKGMKWKIRQTHATVCLLIMRRADNRCFETIKNWWKNTLYSVSLLKLLRLRCQFSFFGSPSLLWFTHKSSSSVLCWSVCRAALGNHIYCNHLPSFSCLPFPACSLNSLSASAAH